MNANEHWESIYKTKDHKQVSWFVDHVQSSLDLIAALKLGKNTGIIDVGGGASTLADDLLAQGYTDISVLDISKSALALSKQRMGLNAAKVMWLEDDVLISEFNGRKYHLWHDRAVFHFLTNEGDRQRYKQKLNDHLEINGHVIFSIFADDGPLKCSGLEIRRHGEADIENYLGGNFETVLTLRSIHKTPAGVEQKFLNFVAKKTF